MKSERKIQSNLSSYSNNEERIHSSMKNIRTATVTKTRHPDEELLHVLTPDINDDT